MRKLLMAFSTVLLFPVVAQAQRGGGGFGGGMGGYDMPRFNAPELPGPELEGPPDSVEAPKLLGLKEDQARQYTGLYAGYMADTKLQRDSVHEQLNLMDDKLSGGDRAAAMFYAERATKVSRGLRDRQSKWEEDSLFNVLSGDQVKAYKKWKKDKAEETEEKQKRDAAMRWNPMMGGMAGSGMDRLDDKTTVNAPVSTPAGTAAAVRVGRTIYISGQVALDAEGNLVGENDLRAQAVKAFANVTAVLQATRARPTDVVRLTVYVVNLKPQDMALIREVGAAFLPQGNPPALTVLGVQSLYREGLLISVEATALAGAGGGQRSGSGRP